MQGIRIFFHGKFVLIGKVEKKFYDLLFEEGFANVISCEHSYISILKQYVSSIILMKRLINRKAER